MGPLWRGQGKAGGMGTRRQIGNGVRGPSVAGVVGVGAWCSEHMVARDGLTGVTVAGVGGLSR